MSQSSPTSLPEGAFRWALFGVLLLGTLLYTLPIKGSVLQTNQIIQGEDSDIYRIQWVQGVENVLGLVAVLASLRLIRVFGLRPVYLTGLACLTIGSLGTSLAHYTWQAVAAGTIRSFSGLFLVPGLTMIQRLTPNHKGIAYCTYLAMLYGGEVLAEPVGSLTAYHPSWRFLFAGTSGLGLVLLLFAIVLFPEDPPLEKPEAPFDWPGLGLFAAWFATLLFLLYRGNYLGWLISAPIVAGICAAVALTVALAWRFTSAPEPFLGLTGLAYRTASLTMGAAAFWSASMFALTTHFGKYLQARGFQDWKAGWIMLPMGILVVVGMILGGFIKRRLVLVWILRLGLAGMTAVAYFGLSQVDSYAPWQRLMALSIPWALCAGPCLPAIGRLVMEGQDPETLQHTAALKFFVRAYGGCMGVLIANVLLDRATAWGLEYLRVSVSLGQGPLEAVLPSIADHMVRHGSGPTDAVSQARSFVNQWVDDQAQIIGYRRALSFCSLLSGIGLCFAMFIRPEKEQSVLDADQ